jgi:hypothetical protein
MSRYSFNPKIDPNRERNRRLIVALVIAAVILIGLSFVACGVSQLTRTPGAGSTSADATPFVPLVTIFAPTPPSQTGDQPATQPGAQPDRSGNTNAAQPAPADTPAPAATMDPRGKVEGIADFVCPNPRSADDEFGYGIQSNWPVGDIGYWNTLMADKLKMDWTKAQVRWDEYEPQQGQNNNGQWQTLDAFVGDANKKGLNIVFGIIHAPAWSRSVNEPGLLGPPDDFNEAARFFGKVAARYKGCVQAIEIWNEMNLDREWTMPSRQIDAADYVRFLDAVAPAIKQVDPNIITVMGALSPTGSTNPGKFTDDFEYMDAFVAAGGPSRVDCVGVHLNGYNMPPDKTWNEGYNDPTAEFRGPFDNPNHSWSFKSTLEGYRQKTGKPLCITEFGWASMENLKRKDGSPTQGAPPGFVFALDNTEKEQADWIVEAFKTMKDSGAVKFAIVFNLDYIQKVGGEPDKENVAPYSVIRQDGSPRPAFDAIANMPR